MKKWYDEEHKFRVEVTGFLRGDHTEQYCHNGEEVGDQHTCIYGCPINQNGQGVYFEAMLLFFPPMGTVRSDGGLENVSGGGPYCKDVARPDDRALSRLTAKKLGSENFFRGNFLG